MGSSPLAGSTSCMKGVARFEGRNAAGSGVHSGSSLFPTKLLTLTRCLGLSLTRAASGKQPPKKRTMAVLRSRHARVCLKVQACLIVQLR